MNEFRQRRGDTLRWMFVKFENDGPPMDLAGATVTCEIEKLSPPLRAPLNISVQDSDQWRVRTQHAAVGNQHLAGRDLSVIGRDHLARWHHQRCRNF